MIVITNYTNAINVALNGASADRKEARIRKIDIRSVVMDTDNVTVELIFTSGEIYKFPYTYATSIDGVTPTSQQHAYDIMNGLLGFDFGGICGKL